MEGIASIEFYFCIGSFIQKQFINSLHPWYKET